MKKVKFKQWECLVKTGYYGNGRKAIMLVDSQDGERIATATVNLPMSAELPDNVVFIKDYSGNEGMVETLRNHYIIEEGEEWLSVKSGFVTISAYMLTEDALKLWEEELWKI